MTRDGASGGRLAAVQGVMRSPDLRRLQFGWAAFFLVDGVSLVALSVWAFAEGGTGAVGALGVARLLPGGLAQPFGAWAADRFSRRRLVTLVFLAMTVVQAGIAVALGADAPRFVVYALVAVASVVASPYRPAHLALAPLVARSAEELVAINVTGGTFEGIVTFVGPAFAALLLAGTEPWFVVAMSAAACACGLVAVAGIRVDSDPSKAMRRAAAKPLTALGGGFVELYRDRRLAVIVGCFIAQLFVRGFLNVFIVSVSFELIDAGDSGVGWLAAAMGIGGILGSVLAVAMTGKRRLGMPFARSLALWGAPIAVIGMLTSPAVAYAAMLVVGLGNAMLDVSGFTLLQRLGTDRILGRVFGVLFTVGILMAALGSLLAPALISWVGLRPMMISVGCLLPLLALVLLPKFRAIDAQTEPPPEVLRLLVGSRLLGPLPPTTLEKLAAHAHVVEVLAGTVIIAEGEQGDLYYSIADGTVAVSRAGQALRTMGPGEQFGEIALLSAGTRTATVTATTTTTLVTIDGAEFVDALSSSQQAMSTGWQTASDYITDDRAETA